MSETLRSALAQSTTEQKKLVLVELARELFRVQGNAPFALKDAEAKTVGFLTPVDGLAGLIPQDSGWIAELRSRMQNPGKTHTPEAFLAALNRVAQTAK